MSEWAGPDTNVEETIIHTKPPSKCPECPGCGRPMWMVRWTYSHPDHEDIFIDGWKCRGRCGARYWLHDDIPPYIPTRFELMDL